VTERIHRARALGAAAAAATLALGAAPAEARPDQVAYVGLHPVHAGGFCYIEAPHVHVYAPTGKAKVMYRMHDDGYHFVGDPVAFKYDGPTYTYYGHHPVYVDAVIDSDMPGNHVEFCYLDGPHYHYYWPPPHAKFEVKGDVYWYVGSFPPAYKKHKRRYATINAVYKPIVYARPVVTVEPPSGYVGVVVPSAHAHVGGAVSAGVGVSAGVEVHVPQPVLEVEVGLPGVVIETDHHHHHHRHHKHKHKKFKRFKRHKKHRKHGVRRLRF